MTSRPVLLLDVMDTLVHDPFFEEMPGFLGLDFQQMLAQRDPTAWVEFEHGQIEEPEFLTRFFGDRRAFDTQAFIEKVQQTYRFIDGIEPLLADLKAAGVQMHTLSNYPTWYQRIEERVGLSRYVQWSFVSCLTGVRKPKAAAYTGAAKTLGVPPQQCLFVDDREKNCEGARAVGMDAILFENANTLRAELERRAVLP